MTPDYPRLNFPAVKLRISQRGEQTTVWDPLRGIYLVLTPEEWAVSYTHLTLPTKAEV